LVAGSYSYLFDNTGTFTLPYNGDIVMTGTNANLTVGGYIKAGSGTFAKTPANGDITLDNGYTDTPGIEFYTANNTNYGIDSFGGYLRFTKNLNETGGYELVQITSASNIVLSQNGTVFDNKRKFDWTAMIHGTPATGGITTGTILGNATYSSVGDGVQLTLATNGQTGSLAWNVSNFDFTRDFAMEFTWYMGGVSGSSADGIWVGVGGSNNFGNNQPVANGSVMMKYATYVNLYTKFWVNGTATGNQLAFHAGINYFANWQTSRLLFRTVGTKRYAYIYTGQSNMMENAIDVTSWTPGGTWIVIGASTGGANSAQYCNHVALEYI